ncbi:MAG: S8 family serine peptidase [Actinobacteria bacterium]|nr:S8 family serine peptidase [Actinomycetota bacterium]
MAALSLVSAAGASKTLPHFGALKTVHFTQTPLGISNKPVTVVVELQQDSVAAQDANSASGLNDQQQSQWASQLQQKQQQVASQIQSQGGQVLAQYQWAYNGMKVRISAAQAYRLQSLPGVAAVYPVQLMKRDNVNGVPLIGAPGVWDGTGGLHGEHMKIAIVDTGIDFTHADFGGPGTAAAYANAEAAKTANPQTDPTTIGYCTTTFNNAAVPCFGPNAPKVKGGIDLAGDTYNPTADNPDNGKLPGPNPLDCDGHGTHVAGTAAGFGVTSNGKTYAGSYDASTVNANTWNVGPGVAPQADLYAVKIFGCQGQTALTIDGIEWAVKNHMDVINLSLGSPFGLADDPAAQAAENAAREGVIVVAADGNEGSSPYMTGSPATATSALSVAAMEGAPSFPGASITPGSGPSVTAIDANGASLAGLPSGLTLKVLQGAAQYGCTSGDFGVVPPKTVVVVQRGGVVNGAPCSRTRKAILGQTAGAAAVVMVNNTSGYPPFEGPITRDPDTGAILAQPVTIPFLGVQTGALTAAVDGQTVTIASAGQVSNPNAGHLGDFSAFGPRTGDSWLKPDVTAPGVSVVSAGMGTGNLGAGLSGTSQATPFASGLAALVKQAHPGWHRALWWKAAIENTASPSGVTGAPSPSADGTGLINAGNAVKTQAIAVGDREAPALNFGFNELEHNFTGTDRLRIRNLGSAPVTFSVATDGNGWGVAHTVSILGPTTVTINPGNFADVPVRLQVAAQTAGSGIVPGWGNPLGELGGTVSLQPQNGTNNGVTLNVPYYMVPQAVSDIDVDLGGLNKKTNTATATVRNHDGAITGSADFYDWGLQDGRDRGLGSNDLRYAGVQAWPSQDVIYFGLATQRRWSNAAQNEFDIYVSVGSNTDPINNPDYDIVVGDQGALTGSDFNGIDEAFVVDLHNSNVTNLDFPVGTTDSSTLSVPILFEQLCDVPGSSWCLAPGGTNQRFTYTMTSFSLVDDTADAFTSGATFDPFNPAVTSADGEIFVDPHQSASETITVDPNEFQQSPALGVMVLSTENPSGRGEVDVMRLNAPGSHH